MQLINQFHRVRKVNSNVVVLTSVFLRVKFVMHTKIARMVKIPPPPAFAELLLREFYLSDAKVHPSRGSAC